MKELIFKFTTAFVFINWLSGMYSWKWVWLCLFGDILFCIIYKRKKPQQKQ